MDSELKQALDDMEKRLIERIEKIEAKLFDAAYGLTRTYEMRSRGQSKAIAILDERLGYVEERLAKLERFSINPRAFQGRLPYSPPPPPSL